MYKSISWFCSWSFFSNHICKYDHLISIPLIDSAVSISFFQHLSSLFPGFYFLRLNMLFTLYILKVLSVLNISYFLSHLLRTIFLTEYHLSCIIEIVLYSFMGIAWIFYKLNISSLLMLLECIYVCVYIHTLKCVKTFLSRI